MVLEKMVKNTGFIRKVSSLFKTKIDKAISIIVTKNLAVKKEESLLIIYDSKKSKLAKRFIDVSKKILDKVDSVKIPILKVNGAEPSKEVSSKLLKYGAAIFLTSKSLSHTKARRDATSLGVRIASMPGITETVLRRSIDIDYSKLKEDTKKVVLLMNKAKKIRVKSAFGTDITFSVEGRRGHGLSAGIYSKKGKWGNLPEGEAFIAPVEGSSQGHFVVDGSIAGFGKLGHPVIFFVKEGVVVKITDGKKPPKIEKMLDSVGSRGRNVAEFGMGLNRKAKVTGVVLEDEKAYGTCHIAFGNNIGFGGKVDVPLHIDCVFNKPSVYFDGKIIMKKGKLVL